jgi:hypothetical protein
MEKAMENSAKPWIFWERHGKNHGKNIGKPWFYPDFFV